MSYKEKTIWLTLSITLYISYWYINNLNILAGAGLMNEARFMSSLFSIALYVTILTVFAHIILAIIDHKAVDEIEDERDELIDLKASRIGYYVLSFSLLGAIVHSQWAAHFGYTTSVFNLTDTHTMIHWVVVGFLLSDTVKYATQLFFYRRGF